MKAKPRLLAWSIALATVLAASAIEGAAPAHSGECPADKIVSGAMSDPGHAASGVTDTVIASIDLAAKGAAYKGDTLRMRLLVVEPGGIVPWHSHGTRPANIYIVSGSILEYRSTCAEPITHKAGEAVSEFGADLAHWWRNESSEPATLISADILHEAMDGGTM
jgi:quercetin dioxygenase-like cupin family protein